MCTKLIDYKSKPLKSLLLPGVHKRLCETIDGHYLGAHSLLREGRKETCSLSDNHSVCNLNTLFANMKNKCLQLGFDPIEQTWTTLMNATQSAFCVEWHKLLAIINAVNLCDQFLPATIVKVGNSCYCARLASRVSRGDKLVNHGDRISLLFDFEWSTDR